MRRGMKKETIDSMAVWTSFETYNIQNGSKTLQNKPKVTKNQQVSLIGFFVRRGLKNETIDSMDVWTLFEIYNILNSSKTIQNKPKVTKNEQLSLIGFFVPGV